MKRAMRTFLNFRALRNAVETARTSVLAASAR